MTDVSISRKDRGWLDRAAIALSGLCMVHCVASAVVIVALASAGGVLLDPIVHELGLVLAIALGAAGLGRGWVLHRLRQPAALGLAGLALMALGLAVPHGLAEVAATLLGVGLLALAHLRNRRALAAGC